MAPFSTKIVWVADLKTGTFLANSRESVRVMGVVVAIGSFSSDDQSVLSPLVKPCDTGLESDDNNSASSSSLGKQVSQQAQCTTTNSTEQGFFSVTIDDGTNSIEFWTPQQMLQQSPLAAPSLVEVGKIYDCILNLRQSCEEKRWFAETLIQIDNPIDEHFRWLELSHHDQSISQSSSSRLRYANLCHKFGFPTRRRNSVEVYRLICLNSQLQQQDQLQRKKQILPIRSNRKIQHNRKHSKLTSRHSLQPQQRHRGLQNISTNRNRNKVRNENLKRRVSLSPATTPRPSPTPTPTQPVLLEGLLLKDLATVLQKSERNVKEMIEDLQLEGKIYQNQRGEYLPL
jgi:hypothetical protein